MDDNQNLDGFDGLPLEFWMNQMQQPALTSVHPSLSATVYHQPPNIQAMREYISPMTMPASYHSDVSMSHPGQSTLPSSTRQQYSHSSSARQSFQEQPPTASERSAWSHMLSLDPTIAPIGTHTTRSEESFTPMHNYSFHEAQQQQVTRESPSLVLKGSSGNQMPVSFNSRSLPRMHYSSALDTAFAATLNSYSHLPPTGPSDNKTSQHLNELMNLSKKVERANRSSLTEGLTISTNLPSLESSGSYSPVSPPAAVLDEPSLTSSGHNAGKVAELLLREPHDITPSVYPMFSDQSEMLNYVSQKDNIYVNEPSSLDSAAFSKSSQMAVSSTLVPSPSNSPLDMTTAVGLRADKSWQDALPKVSSHMGAGLVTASVSSASEQAPLLQTLLSKKPILSLDSSKGASVAPTDRRNQPHPLAIASQEKAIKPLKSTPKKSNFYGRDASLFSFSQPPIADPELSQSAVTSQTTNAENLTGLSTTSAVKSNDIGDGSAGPLSEQIESTLSVTPSLSHMGPVISSGFGLETFVCENISTEAEPKSNVNQTNSVEFSEPVLPLTISEGEEFTDFQDQNHEKKIDSTESGQLEGSDENAINCFESNDKDQESDKKQNSTNGNPDQPNQNATLAAEPVIDTSLLLTVPNKVKPTKRKKRKATGFQTKPRKKPLRKPKRGQKISVTKEAASTEVTDEEDVAETSVNELEDIQEDANGSNSESQQPTRKRLLSKTKSATTDPSPRRSSSRRSKDNAMRLIELQADSNYNGISETPAVIVNKKTGRKKRAQGHSKVSDNEHNDWNEDESCEEGESDEKDGDYFIDEDDVQVFDNDSKLEEQISLKRKPKEKKLGGLKISIKLSGNSSAEIVSGIDEPSVKKKRKVAKKKVTKKKQKGKTSTEELDLLEEPDQGNQISETEENVLSTISSSGGDKSEMGGDRQMTLMEKYFSSASSATAAQQLKRKSVSSMGSQMKKKAKGKADDSKFGKGKAKTQKSIIDSNKKLSSSSESVNQKSKSSVKFSLDDTGDRVDMDIKDGVETAIPKFVCGYCPQRYHNKNDLRAHMEEHMVEMEGQNNVEQSQEQEESKKSSTSAVSPSSNRDPRSNRMGVAGNEPMSKTISTEKSKATVEQTKDIPLKPATVTVKQLFDCGECGQVFSSKPNLLEHVRIHTAEKPFECDICHKCFKERNLLSVHRKTHGQEKLMRCQICSKAFVHKADLDFHMQSHPKRSAISISGKKVLSAKKSSKKVIDEREDALPPKKPKSFASALSGDMDITGKGKDAPAVLVLKRGDPISAESKNKTGSLVKTSETKLSLKPSASTVEKTNFTGKSTDSLKKPPENVVTVNKLNSEDQKEKMQQNVKRETENKVEKKQNESNSSDVCTCKECPECVTRFLQSFE